MCPKYPRLANLGPRSAKTASAPGDLGVTAPTSRCGPGRIAVRATTPPAAVTLAATSISILHGTGPKLLIRCGSAEPSVRAASTIPNIRPRSADADHDAISFIPTG